MTSRMKIVHIHLLPLMIGLQKVSLDELAYLVRQRYDPIVICNYQWDIAFAFLGESHTSVKAIFKFLQGFPARSLTT
jgi:hypothetical protein